MDKAVEELQQELKVLKNEIKETLTDVREVLLNTVENPFPQDLSSRMSPSSPAPQATPRPTPAPQQEAPPQPPIMPQQGGMGMGGPGGGPLVFGSMGGGPAGGYPSMPQVVMQGTPQAPAPAPQYNAPNAPPQAPAHAAQEPYAPSFAPASGGGPGLPPPSVRRERPASSDSRSSDGPGLPPRTRPAGEQRAPREEVREAADPGPARGPSRSSERKGPIRSNDRRRPFSAAPMIEEEAYEADDDRYEEPREEDGYYEEHEEAQPRGKVDLVVLASLSPWLSEGIRRIGRKRIKAVLDIYASMGGMTRNLKDVLAQIVDMDDTEGTQATVSVQDSMRLLIELDDLMWRGRQDWRRAALMTMLSADERFSS